CGSGRSERGRARTNPERPGPEVRERSRAAGIRQRAACSGERASAGHLRGLPGAVDDPLALARGEPAPDAVRLVPLQGVLATALEDRTGEAVLLGLGLTTLPDRSAFGVRRKEDVGIDGATCTLVLPLPVLDDRGGQAAQVRHCGPFRTAGGRRS